MLNRKAINKHKQNKEIALLKNDKKLLEDTNEEFTKEFIDHINMLQKVIQNLKNECKIDLNLYKENIKNNKLSKTVKTSAEAIELINNTNLFKYFGFNYKEKEIFKLDVPVEVKYIACKINNTKEEYENIINELSKEYGLNNIYVKDFDKKHQVIEAYIAIYNNAYINKDIDGKYHIYIGNSYKEYKLKYSFIDIYCMLFNIQHPQEAIIQLIELLDIHVSDADLLKQIYRNNIKMIENISKAKYPNLYKLINKHVYVLKEILTIAIRQSDAKSINKIKYSQNDIAERVGCRQSSILYYINGFAVLEFYEKEEVKKTNDDESVRNRTTEYIIHEYTEETFVKAENIAKQLLDKGTRFSKIKAKTIIECFGESIAKKVFKDKVVRKKIWNEDKIYC
jgi:hypothetical protein